MSWGRVLDEYIFIKISHVTGKIKRSNIWKRKEEKNEKMKKWKNEKMKKMKFHQKYFISSKILSMLRITWRQHGLSVHTTSPLVLPRENLKENFWKNIFLAELRKLSSWNYSSHKASRGTFQSFTISHDPPYSPRSCF